MRWLRVIVSQKIDGVVQWAVLRLGGEKEGGQAVGRRVQDRAQVVAGGAQVEGVWDGVAGLKDVEQDLVW